MGSLSIWHWLIVAVIVMILFGGRGKVSELMGDFAKGIKAFKKGMADDDEPAKDAQARGAPPASSGEPMRTLPHQSDTAQASSSQPAKAPADRAV